jgi:hypothetical protein
MDAYAGSRDSSAVVHRRTTWAFVLAAVRGHATGRHDHEDDREPRGWEEDDKHDERFGYLREV